jgi:hypothetical protein
MNEVKVEQLIEALIPLLGYWEYAEDIIAKLREWTVSENAVEELTDLLRNVNKTAKDERNLVDMTIAYETSKYWKQKEIQEHTASNDSIENTLNAFDSL